MFVSNCTVSAWWYMITGAVLLKGYFIVMCVAVLLKMQFICITVMLKMILVQLICVQSDARIV